ncbi:glycoside hydrolase family 20 zincin-like fold domain-containing protein [Puia sp. P3]|uniref:glycoside hydrolase family 20 zincin-like fold domain-containing protein n=1 Tax=Puia sp. P3 TaxID=3423952 RepID=UPI003D67DA49
MQRLSAALLTLALLISKAHAAPDPSIHLIPQPVSVKQQTGSFTLDKSVVLSVETPAFDHPAGWFTGQLEKSTGIRMRRGKSGKVLQIATMADRNVLGKEGYTLTVTPSRIVLRANDAAGVFYGLQTLLQLQTGGTSPALRSWTTPALPGGD